MTEAGELDLPMGFAGIGVGTVVTVTDGEAIILEGTFGERVDFEFKVPLQPIGESTVRGRTAGEKPQRDWGQGLNSEQ